MHPMPGHADAGLLRLLVLVPAGLLAVVRFAVARCLPSPQPARAMQSGRQQICYHQLYPFRALSQGVSNPPRAVLVPANWTIGLLSHVSIVCFKGYLGQCMRSIRSFGKIAVQGFRCAADPSGMRSRHVVSGPLLASRVLGGALVLHCPPVSALAVCAPTARAMVGGDDQVSAVIAAPVAFIRISTPIGSEACSGTLISPTVVMTAAHCVYETSDSGNLLGVARPAPSPCGRSGNVADPALGVRGVSLRTCAAALPLERGQSLTRHRAARPRPLAAAAPR